MTIEEINELIVRMTENGATQEELAKIIEYSKYVIDAESVRKSNNIQELIDKYSKKSGRYKWGGNISKDRESAAISFIANILYKTIKEGDISDEERDNLIEISETL